MCLDRIPPLAVVALPPVADHRRLREARARQRGGGAGVATRR